MTVARPNPKPFSLDADPARSGVEARSLEYLRSFKPIVARRFDPALSQPAPLPGASVEERTLTSMAVQALWGAAATDGHFAFNVIDGWAHGIGSILAQFPPEAREAAISLLTNNIRGYEARTRSTLNPPERAGAPR